MKPNLRPFLTATVLAPFALLLFGCDGGVSTDDTRLGPTSLSDTTLTFTNTGGATMSFVAARGQSGDVELGGIVDYTQGLGASITFVSVNTGESIVLSFPDTFTGASYQFTPIGQSSGEIRFWGISFLDDDESISLFEGATTSANPLILTVLFDNGGTSVIQSLEMQLDLPGGGSLLLSGSDSGDLTLTSGGSVPVGYGTDYDGFSEFTDGTFTGTTLLLTDAITEETRDFLFGASGTTGGSGFDADNPITEAGTALVIDSLTGASYESVDYVARQQSGTDDVTLDLDFNASTTNVTTLPNSVLYTLTYDTTDRGTYVADDGSSGTFLQND